MRTLDRLGSVCEVAHRLGEAELCYRRALTIASTTLTPDHPLVTKTRANLLQFCEAHNLPAEF